MLAHVHDSKYYWFDLRMVHSRQVHDDSLKPFPAHDNDSNEVRVQVALESSASMTPDGFCDQARHVGYPLKWRGL
jgi:hypothetical protein